MIGTRPIGVSPVGVGGGTGALTDALSPALGEDAQPLVMRLRSAASATLDLTRLYFNGDTTDANYIRNQVFGNGVNPASDSANEPRGPHATGASSLANTFAHSLTIINRPQDTSKTKDSVAIQFARFATNTGEANLECGVHGNNWESTAAIIRIQLRTDNHPTDLLVAGSSMRLIGYRTLTVLT